MGRCCRLGAECCLALADAVSGSEEAFVQRMNQKAKSIGMKKVPFYGLYRTP